jgi:hypothetical protein
MIRNIRKLNQIGWRLAFFYSLHASTVNNRVRHSQRSTGSTSSACTVIIGAACPFDRT